MSLFLFAQSNGHVSSGHLPLATVVSFAAHAAVLLGAPLSFPAASSMAPLSATSAIQVELTPFSGTARSAAVRASQRAPVSLPRAQDMPASPPVQPAGAGSPEPTNVAVSTKPRALTAETNESGHARVDGATSVSLEAPSARLAPAPVYPEEARWERRTGRVVLNFHIQPDGAVGDARVLDSSGHADLDQAALAALNRWKFDAPSVVSGTSYRYAFRFDLL